jgi:hypothetical protein
MPAFNTPHSKRPVSARQLAANRANAARSTGPRTAEGKARAAQNARRHGFAAADYAVVRLEDLQAVARLKADLVAVYHPVNSQELFAIERIALAQQALLRAARLEAGLFTTCLNEALDPTGNPIVPMSQDLVGDLELTRAQNRKFALAEGFRRLVREGNTFALLLRYQAQAERQYRRAIEEFERLKALRGELPNKPIFEGQPEETAPPSAPPETNPTEPADAAPPAPGPVPVAAGTSARDPRDPDAKPERQSPGGLRATDAHAAPVQVNGPQRAQPAEVRRSALPAIPGQGSLAGIGAGQRACDPGAVSLDRDSRLAGAARGSAVYG